MSITSTEMSDLRVMLREGKYTRHFATCSVDQFRGILWLLGEFQVRVGSREIYELFKDKVHVRAIAAIARLCSLEAPSFNEAMDTIRKARNGDETLDFPDFLAAGKELREQKLENARLVHCLALVREQLSLVYTSPEETRNAPYKEWRKTVNLYEGAARKLNSPRVFVEGDTSVEVWGDRISNGFRRKSAGNYFYPVDCGTIAEISFYLKVKIAVQRWIDGADPCIVGLTEEVQP